MKKVIDISDDSEILKYVGEIEDILDSIRVLEHRLIDADMSYDLFETEMIMIKLNLRSIKRNLYAIDDIQSVEIIE